MVAIYYIKLTVLTSCVFNKISIFEEILNIPSIKTNNPMSNNNQTVASSANTKKNGKLSMKTLFVLILMSSITFIAILSEMVPSGILPHISEGLGINDAQAGQMVGIYALASAICAIPLVTATMRFNRKGLLLWLLVGFAISNIAVAFSHSYYLTLSLRVIGGIAAGILWAMITAYGMSIVPDNMHGRAIAIIMAGNTLGVSLGMPFMTWIGNTWGWRTEFIALGLLITLILVLCFFFLPSVPGEKVTAANNPIALLKNKRVLIILLLTLLGVMAHYASYTFITSIVEEIALPGGIEMALILFGIGSFISVMMAMKYTDTALRKFSAIMFALGAIGLGAILLFPGNHIICYAAFFIWGISFGPLVTMLQAAVANQSSSAKAIATSVQSSMFNFSIMFATSIGGFLLMGYGIMSVVLMSVMLLIPAAVITVMAKNTMGEK